MTASVELQNAVCRKAFVMPRVVDNPQAEGEISVDDVSDEDKQAVMSLLQVSVEKLAASLNETAS